MLKLDNMNTKSSKRGKKHRNMDPTKMNEYEKQLKTLEGDFNQFVKIVENKQGKLPGTDKKVKRETVCRHCYTKSNETNFKQSHHMRSCMINFLKMKGNNLDNYRDNIHAVHFGSQEKW